MKRRIWLSEHEKLPSIRTYSAFDQSNYFIQYSNEWALKQKNELRWSQKNVDWISHRKHLKLCILHANWNHYLAAYAVRTITVLVDWHIVKIFLEKSKICAQLNDMIPTSSVIQCKEKNWELSGFLPVWVLSYSCII